MAGVGLLTTLAFGAMAAWLNVEADASQLADQELPFMQACATWKQQMPHLRRANIVIIDAPTPERAGDIQNRLGAAMAGEPGLFRNLFLPGADPFLARHDALYLDRDALDRLIERLTAAQPVLATLARRPNLAGLLEAAELDGQACRALAPGFDGLTREAQTTVRGASPGFSWLALYGHEEIGASRRLIVFHGTLDETDAAVARQATERLNRLVETMGFDKSGIRIRLTGREPLSGEEVTRTLHGIQLAGGASLVLVVTMLRVGLRSWRLVAASLLILSAGLVWTGGFAAATYGTLNTLSIAFAVLYVGLRIDFAIHLALRLSRPRKPRSPPCAWRH